MYTPPDGDDDEEVLSTIMVPIGLIPLPGDMVDLIIKDGRIKSNYVTLTRRFTLLTGAFACTIGVCLPSDLDDMDDEAY